MSPSERAAHIVDLKGLVKWKYGPKGNSEVRIVGLTPDGQVKIDLPQMAKVHVCPPDVAYSAIHAIPLPGQQVDEALHRSGSKAQFYERPERHD
jgi:hypothetical protein